MVNNGVVGCCTEVILQVKELEQRLTERLDLILEERQDLHSRLTEAEKKLTEAVDKLSVAEEKILRLG